MVGNRILAMSSQESHSSTLQDYQKNYLKKWNSEVQHMKDREPVIAAANRGEDWIITAYRLNVKKKTADQWIKEGGVEKKKQVGYMIDTNDKNSRAIWT